MIWTGFNPALLDRFGLYFKQSPIQEHPEGGYKFDWISKEDMKMEKLQKEVQAKINEVAQALTDLNYTQREAAIALANALSRAAGSEIAYTEASAAAPGPKPKKAKAAKVSKVSGAVDPERVARAKKAWATRKANAATAARSAAVKKGQKKAAKKQLDEKFPKAE